MSLRVRITVLTAILNAFTSTIIGFATYTTVAWVQLEQLDLSLQSSLGSTAIRPGNPNNPPPRHTDRDATDFANPVAIAGVNTDGEITVARPSGTASDPEPFPTIPASLIALGADQFVTFFDTETSQSYRANSRTLPRGGNLIALTFLESYQGFLNSIALRTFFIVVASTFFGGLIAWFTVRRSHRPVTEMVQAAGEIAAGDIRHRMPEGTPGTGLDVLSSPMNSMVDSLTLSLQKLEQSEERLRAFVSDASHEIRTPLTVIRGYAELLVRNTDDSTSELEERALRRIHSESLRLDRLVTALLQLDLAHSTCTSPVNFSLTSLVRDLFADLTQLSGGKVEFDLPELEITGSEEGWSQLMANIGQNISRHTPLDSALSVRLERNSKEGSDWFTLSVDDRGLGIPSKDREMVFDSFTLWRIRPWHEHR